MHRSVIIIGTSVACLLLALAGCTNEQEIRFERLSASQTGVDFNNTIVEDDSLLNPLDFEYVYNGGGVAVGDLNGNGRPDLYFAGNVVSNRLYLNQGGFQFEDVTEAAGVAANGVWSTGLALVDINQDGLLDIYVCVGGPPELQAERANRLYVNQGIDEAGMPSFEEQAAAYGIADRRYSTQAAFFDYDRDGDLDLYVLTTEMREVNRNAIRPRYTQGEAPNTDRLYQNNGDGTFTEVSEEAGIQVEGHGLGVATSDINHDGWVDIYVANDFISNDLLYLNNGDGTFTNRIARSLKHQSHSAMGVDVADFNNDGWNDIFVLDMLPPERRRNQLMSRFFDRRSFQGALRFGYEPQYVRNTLQLNHGPRPKGALAFSEVGQLAGVDATDWSWAPLFADFDNDGRRDLFVTNGYGKDVTNLDFVQRREKILAFGTAEAQREQLREEMSELPEVELPNYFFENEGDLTFTDRTGTWAPSPPGLSNGATVADLDQDGDLDVVTNNINDEATLLKNRTSERDSTHALRVALHGPDGNRGGLGAKVLLSNDGATQYYEHSPYRGYQSTVQPVAHFGLGADSTADSLSVVWPDGSTQLLTDVAAGQVLDVRYEAATPPSADGGGAASVRNDSQKARLFREGTAGEKMDYRHEDRAVKEFEQTPILPHKLSKEGPGLAVGDLSGNGLDDVFVGADQGHRSALFRQIRPGAFRRDTLDGTSRFEDRGALVFDADGDGDQDLYVVSGGPVQTSGGAAYQDRLYLNDTGSESGTGGAGTLRRMSDALPEMHTSGSVVAAADYDGDGDLDLFVGGRVRPGAYPLPPRSYLLRNDSKEGQPRFTDVTDEIAPALTEVGLVTDALWTDYNNDEQIDLMVAGEWMPITVFEHGEAGFTEVTRDVGLAETSGWWRSLAAGDFDQDGDTDYVAGNLGLNTRYQASPSAPVRVHAKDYDQSGQIDPVLTHVVDGTRYPLPRRDEMIAQIPALKNRFPTYSGYAEASFSDVFTETEREGAYVREAVCFETSYLENEDDGTFGVRALPRSVQTAPVFGMETGDYNGDGHLDLLMVGNWYAPNVWTGRADAFMGAYLKGDGTGRFAVEGGTESGFFVDGDAKGLAEVATDGRAPLMVATQNDGPLKVFHAQESVRHVRLRPLDRYALLTFEDGSTRKEEFFYGSAYLSQSSRILHLPDSVEKVVIYDSSGNRRTVSLDRTPLAESGKGKDE